MTNSFKALEQALAAIPRFPLLDAPTPIQPLERLNRSGLLGGVALYVKRDDLGGLGGGGSKLRKLEFLVADALARGADTLVAFGGRQSNSLRLAAAAAARAGLRVELVLGRPLIPSQEYKESGNMLLNNLLGARLNRAPMGANPENFARDLADKLTGKGRRVYLLPMGASGALGSLGYVAGALELAQQSQALRHDWAGLVLPNGSSGSQAGLVVGMKALGFEAARVQGQAVLGPASESVSRTLELAQLAARRLDLGVEVAADDIRIKDGSLGGGYGQPSPEMVSAVRMLASQEGLLLDPVYGGKAMAGLLDDIAAGRYQPGQKVLFLMTGGSPALFAYRDNFSETPQ